MSDEQKVWEYLEKHAYDKDHAKTADEIQQHCNIKSGRTQEPTRNIIRNLRNQKKPIGSSNKGYFIITTNEIKNEYRKNLEERIRGLREDINLIKDINFDNSQ